MEYSQLATEKRNEDSVNLDMMTTMEAVKLMNRMDAEICIAIEKVLPQIAKAVDIAVEAFNKGGRLIYCGCGTSGRLGVLDASECPPTYGVPPETVVGKIAGGDTALRFAVEGAEDSEELGAQDMEKLGVGECDFVVAVSASGGAPYCKGSLKYAREHFAKTGGVACVGAPGFADLCDCLINPVVGPEIVTGSTRLRAGTATKMILNMISTLSMVQIGKVYKNFMVDVMPTNKKLYDRATRIVMDACELEREEATSLLNLCNGEIKTAIVCHEAGVSVEIARQALNENGGFVRRAVNSI